MKTWQTLPVISGSNNFMANWQQYNIFVATQNKDKKTGITLLKLACMTITYISIQNIGSTFLVISGSNNFKRENNIFSSYHKRIVNKSPNRHVLFDGKYVIADLVYGK